MQRISTSGLELIDSSSNLIFKLPFTKQNSCLRPNQSAKGNANYSVRRLQYLRQQQKQTISDQVSNPPNLYLIRRMKSYFHRVEISTSKRSKTQPQCTDSVVSRLAQSPSQQSEGLTDLEDQSSIQPAYLINEIQKMQRLLARRSEQEQCYKCLSQRIKFKSNKKRLQKVTLPEIKPMETLTWYQNWLKDEKREKAWKQSQVSLRLKNSLPHKFHSIRIFT